MTSPDRMWVLVDVGCIECHEESGIVGVFSDESAADRLAKKLNEDHSFTSGQHDYVVFPCRKWTSSPPHIGKCSPAPQRFRQISKRSN